MKQNRGKQQGSTIVYGEIEQNIIAEIVARSLANFHCQQADKHMNV